MRLDLYIARQALAASLIVIGSLTGIIWLSQSLRFVELIINRGVPLETLVYLTMLLLPSWLSLVLPIAVFVSVLFVYNRMTGDREIVVLEASGFSPIRLARPALMVAAVATVMCYALSLWVIPVSYRAFKDLQYQIRHDYAGLILREGVFNSITDNVMLFVRTHRAGNEIEGIIIHDQRDRDESVTYFARTGRLAITPDGPTLGLTSGTRQARDIESRKVEFLSFDSYDVDFRSVREDTGRAARDRNELFISDLLNPRVEFALERDFGSLVAEGHHRLTAPLLALVLPLAGLAVLLRGELSRRGSAMRIIVAVAIAVGLEVLVIAGKLLAARHAWLIPGLYIAVLLPGLVALMALIGHRLRRRPVPAAP